MEKGEDRMLTTSEREKALNFVGLILLYADFHLPWSDTISSTDVSPEGFGICEMACTPQESKILGKWNERWRFKRLPVDQWAPRARALHRVVFSDVGTLMV